MRPYLHSLSSNFIFSPLSRNPTSIRPITNYTNVDDEMSALVKRPRPQRQRAPVNYRVDDDSDADDSDIDAGVDDDPDDDAEQPFELL